MGKRSVVANTIRERVVSARRFGTLHAGGRLPSARILAVELDADPRVVAAAYRSLEREGLVERRPPSRGFFVAGHASDRAARASLGHGAAPSTNGHWHGDDARPVEWLAGVLAQALERDIPVPAFPERAWQATDTLRVRAACLEDNRDHLTWLCRELREDYGIEAVAVPVGTLAVDPTETAVDRLPLAIRRADVLVTTRTFAAAVQPLAARVGRACIVVGHRDDLTRDLERRLAEGPVYFVGTDPRFAERLHEAYAGRVDPSHVRPVILGEPGVGVGDAVAAIPPGAAVYVMRTARDRLGGLPPQVQVLPTLRAFARETRLEILRLLVARNLAAWSAQQGVAAGAQRAGHS